jgi:hypothetical protein
MPSKRRGRPAAAQAQTQAQASRPSPAAPSFRADDDNDNGNDSNHHTDQDDEDSNREDGEEEEQKIRFFNTTFSTFRVSPLYIGTQEPLGLGLARLETLSRRLRDTLVGDVVRGVQVGLESDATLGRAGALEKVEWRWGSMQALLPTLVQHREKRRPGRRPKRVPQLLCLELKYENITFTALMLPSLDDQEEKKGGLRVPSWTGNTEDQDQSSFIHLPLLLTRMPTPLKAVLVNFLSSTFDCRISPLHLGTRTLIHSWERWIEASGVAEGKVLNKDVALTLGFHLEPPEDKAMKDSLNNDKGSETPVQVGLKTIDVVVPAEEVRRFLRVGARSTPEGSRKRPTDVTEQERIRRRKIAGGKDEEGWAWRETPRPDDNNNNNNDHDNSSVGGVETFDQPFTDALARYLDHHLAIDMFHPGVRVLRVVCDAFALSEGRMKIFASPSRGQASGEAEAGNTAVEMFVRDFVRRAQGRDWSQSALRLASMVADGH